MPVRTLLRVAVALPLVVALVPGMLPATSAAAEPAPAYMPLVPGLIWEYETVGGDTWTTSVGGPLQVRGRPTTTLSDVISVPEPQVVENYWSVDASGSVYLHGAHNLTHGMVLAYEPPILWLAAPLRVGETWGTSVEVYSVLEGGAPYTEAMLVYGALVEMDLAVPAGTFPVFGVGFIEPPRLDKGDGRVFDVRGRLLGGNGGDKDDIVGEADHWYSDGTGVVQQSFIGLLFRLTNWNGPTATTAATWGRVKDLYR